MIEFIAHKNQTLKAHLVGVADLCKKNASKIGCADYGELLGLLHDLGKYSKIFQDYIKSAIGEFNPDVDEDYVDAKGLKGKIDHSTAGAQYVWKKFSSGLPIKRLLAQILSLCLTSHHSGLIDCLTTDEQGTHDVFSRRINKDKEKTHYNEVIINAEILEIATKLLQKPSVTKPLENILKEAFLHSPVKNQNSTVFQFYEGLLVRFLFSSLIDADQQDSADSEITEADNCRQNGMYQSWEIITEKFEQEIKKFGKPKTQVNKIRQNVSEQCLQSSDKPKGLFTLTVPTGGGKTLASLRFALHHAKKHTMERIIYIIPFTSIIDQNAQVVRTILEIENEEKGKIVLEHHSNIVPEKQSWKEKILTENWDAPIVYTTMVQFLETLFGGGTRGVRRMHQLANSVLIFDEIQTLPIKSAHMFCNAVNFLVKLCGSSVVLCTATQPLLGEIDASKGSLSLKLENEIMTDVQSLFSKLRRVNVIDARKSSSWNDDEVAELAIRETEINGNCLIVVNMKASARTLYKVLSEKTSATIFHLSTGMCPVHRKNILNEIRKRLSLDKTMPTICVSTQLIEAGVDIDFGSVIRYCAGLDSIAQAAGRCNRNGNRNIGNLYIVNPVEENITYLKDIAVGKEKTDRVLNDYNDDPDKYHKDRIGPSLLSWYYKNYFFDRKREMEYPVSHKESGRDDTLLNMLSTNHLTVNDFERNNKVKSSLMLNQSFATAGQLFKSIDAPTQSIIVQYGIYGKALVNSLCSAESIKDMFNLIREAQQYSVNLFPHEFKRLQEEKAIFQIQDDLDIFYLDAHYYSEQTGISMEPIGEGDFLYV